MTARRVLAGRAPWPHDPAFGSMALTRSEGESAKMARRPRNPPLRRSRPPLRPRRARPGDGEGTAGWSKKISAGLTLMALVGAVVAQYLGLWKDMFGNGGDSVSSGPSSSASASAAPGRLPPAPTGSNAVCGMSEKDVVLTLDGRPTRSAAHVVATVRCTPAPGDHLSWIVRKETGSAANPRTHYTLRYDLSDGPGRYTYDSDLSTTAPGSERTLSVVLMDGDTYQQVKKTADPATGYVQLPSPVPNESNSVLIKTPR